jgi:calcineurin-like phosphoesterase family protein
MNLKTCIFLVTDTLFYPKGKLPEDCKTRPEDYQKRILENLKKKVTADDIVIHLGDISSGVNEQEFIREMIKASHTKKWILVRGDRDKGSDHWYLNNGFTLVVTELAIKTTGGLVLLTHKPYYGSNTRKSEFLKNVHGHTCGTARKNAPLMVDHDLTWHLEFDFSKANFEPAALGTIIQKLTPKRTALSTTLKLLEKEKEEERKKLAAEGFLMPKWET